MNSKVPGQTDQVDETKQRSTSDYADQAEHQCMAAESNEQLCSLERTSNLVVVQAEQLPSRNETKLSIEYTCADQAEHQYMATGDDEP